MTRKYTDPSKNEKTETLDISSLWNTITKSRKGADAIFIATPANLAKTFRPYITES